MGSTHRHSSNDHILAIGCWMVGSRNSDEEAQSFETRCGLSVWLTIPSARPVEEAEPVLKQWRERGYKIALWTDSCAPGLTPQYRISETAHVEMQHTPETYPGYAVAVNKLIRHVMRRYDDADWFVTGGDDVLPDPNKSAEEIALECSDHFRLVNGTIMSMPHRVHREPPETFGVMQPTGHRYGEDPTNPNPALRTAYIDRVAGSPWMGRSWCERINQGKGPLWPEFQHMHVDECLRAVAVKLGVYWERPDLIHFHNHWGLPREGERHGQADRMPEHLKKWNTPEHWRESKAILDRLKAEDFKSCLPL
jgi:hypothetical protein